MLRAKTKRTRVLVVDDSPFVCRLLASHIRECAELELVGMAHEGEIAFKLTAILQPDAITLDLEMPGLDGLKTLERIMHEYPTPVVVVSGVSRTAANNTLQAINLGAVDFVLKYSPGIDTDPDLLKHEIVSKLKAAARIKVVRSIQQRGGSKWPLPLIRPVATGLDEKFGGAANSIRAPGAISELPLPHAGVVVIGASTGGPVALRELLGQLPANFPAAVIVVQHLPPAFSQVLVAQLNQQIALKVVEAKLGDRLEPGLVLVVPGGANLRLTREGTVVLDSKLSERALSPSIDVSMRAAAAVYRGRATGVILTGMGDDGARGMTEIKQAGGATFVQDAESCVVNGMPQRAVDLGVVDRVLPLDQLAAQLLRLCRARAGAAA